MGDRSKIALELVEAPRSLQEPVNDHRSPFARKELQCRFGGATFRPVMPSVLDDVWSCHQGSGFQYTVSLKTVLALSRSEEHTSELQSLMRISYAVFRMKKNTQSI